MNRLPILLLACLLSFAGISSLNSYVSGNPPAENGDESLDHPRFTLDRRLPELRFDNVGLADTIDFLQDVTGAKIFVNLKAIENAGIDRNTPVTMKLRDIKVNDALDQLLKSASTDKVKLAWVMLDGVITISTDVDLQTNVVSRVYDTRFLADWRKNAATTQPSTRPSEPADPLLRILYGSIAPESWKVNGGSGEIKEGSDGRLMIAATLKNHVAIQNLIENLKRVTEGK